MAEARPADQVHAEDWAGSMGDKWLANIDRFEGMIAAAGAAFMAHAAFRPGERVVDIGCGGGATTIEIGRSVGPGGEACGLDISPVLISEAERRARAAGVDNVRFLVADATKARPDGAPFDRLASRFGSMFFSDPPAAFANMHAMLNPAGRVDLVVWGPPGENPWRTTMMDVVGRYLDLPPPVPHAPGPFGLSDPDYLRSLLAQAGFGDVTMDQWQGEVLAGGHGATPGEAADFVLNALQFAEALAEQPPEVTERVRADLIAEFAQHAVPAGIRMEATTWLVAAVAT